MLEQALGFRQRGRGGAIVIGAQRQDEIAGPGLVAVGRKNARLPKNIFVGGRADHQPRLLHPRQRRDLPGDPHQNDRIEIGRATDLVDDHAHSRPMVSAKTTSASSKHLSGALTTPAPTCPTPGSRCAMPVLMVGTMPVSTTRRMSMPVGTPAKSMAGMVQTGLAPTAISAIERVNAA